MAGARNGRRPSDRPVSATEVARIAGVSQKTVSRVVNDDRHVSDAVRERVQAAIATLGYRPNRAARSLVLGRYRAIGMLALGTMDYGPASLTVGSERAIREAGYALLFATTNDDEPAVINKEIENLLAQGVDGIVINEPIGSLTLTSAVSDVPLLSQSGVYGASACEIVVDPAMVDGSGLAVRHLLDLGHRTVHHISGPPRWRVSDLRRSGWRQALEAAGAPVPPVLVGDWTARSGYEAGQRLAADPDVTAVFAANDQMALGLMRALRQAGRRVPQDVSVVGFDDIPEAEFLTPALTTLRQDLLGIAAYGVGLLVEAIENPGPRRRTELVPLDLVLRETTGPAPSGRPRRRSTGGVGGEVRPAVPDN